MAEWNRDTPWRQGHLLGNDAIEALGLHHREVPAQTLVIVASHDCDLAQAPEREPAIEVVVGHMVTSRESQFTHAKNARKLQVEFLCAPDFWAEFDATAKSSIDKCKLNDFSPGADAKLSPENQAVFQMWLASRYRRSAFPDEFERRLKKFDLHEKIDKAVKPRGELIAGVFFDVDEGTDLRRDGPDDTYKLDLTILHWADSDFESAEMAAGDAAKAIEKAFKEKLFDLKTGWRYIELRSCEPVSESVLTYQQFKQLKRWRLEHISLAAAPQQTLLAE